MSASGSCNGSLTVTLARRVPGQLTVKVTLEHKFGHEPVAVSRLPTSSKTISSEQRPLAQTIKTESVQQPHTIVRTTAPSLSPSRTARDSSIVKDVLRALGRRPRSPEPFKQELVRPQKVDENAQTQLPGAEPVKLGRGRPRKKVDPNAPVVVKPKNPIGRPRKHPAPVLTVNSAMANQMVNGGTRSNLNTDAGFNKLSSGQAPAIHPLPTVAAAQV